MKKRILSVFLSVLFIISSFPFSVLPSFAVTSGELEGGFSWTFEDGKLTVSGSGDFTETSSWNELKYRIKDTLCSVVIEEGITGIGSDVFENCSSLDSVTLAESVARIGRKAFYNCSSLVKIEVPSSVTSIGEYAFYGCTSLKSAELREGLETIGDDAFKDCKLLESISIPSTVTGIGSYAFYGCESLKSADLCEGLETIGDGAFKDCKLLESVSVPSTVKSIGDSAFYNCASITEISVPKGVEIIEDHTFYGCESLETALISESVTVIGNGAFSGCFSLDDVSIPSSVTSIGSRAFYECKSIKEIDVPDGVTAIDYETFCGCESLEKITLPDSVKCIESDAFYKTAYCSDPANRTDGFLYIGNHLIDAPDDLAGDCVVGGEISSVAASAFSNCRALTSVELPESVTRIAYQTFFNCTSLAELVIPDSVTSIGSSAFSGCTSLSEIILPEGVNSIEACAFKDCTSLSRISIPEGVLGIEYGAFMDCTSLSEVIIPEGVTSIGDFAFGGCSLISELTVPDSVKRIGTGAFKGCSVLESVKLSNSVTAITYSTFANCTSLKSIDIPDSVTQIVYSAFNNCIALEEVVAPVSLKKIESFAFSDCNALETVYYKGTENEWNSVNVSSTGNEALVDAEKVFGYVPYSIFSETENGVSLDKYNGMEEDFTVPAEYEGDPVVAIGENAFKGNKKVTSVTIPESVTEIGEGAFDGCSSLEKIIYEGETLPCPVERSELSEKASRSFRGNSKVKVGSENATDETELILFTADKTGFQYIFTYGAGLHTVWVYDEDGKLTEGGYEDSLDGSGEVELYVDCVKDETYYIVVRCIGTAAPVELVVNYTSDVFGDADGNDRVTISDVLRIRKLIAGTSDEDEISLLAADVNGDDAVSIADVLLVRKYLAGVITEFAGYKAIYCPKFYFEGDMTEMNDKKDVRKITFEYQNRQQNITGTAKIKVQGSSSLQYPKKNYTINFYENSDCSDNLKIDFGWGAQNKYCLKANWIDKTHTRNVVTAKIASEVQEKYGLMEDSPNNGVIDGFPVEVYINGSFHGLYTLNIPKDEWTFNMYKDDPNHIVLGGENWNAPVLFTEVPTDFSAWTVEVGPENEETLQKLQRLVRFVLESSDEEFKANIDQYLNLDATINYYILLHYCWMADNSGKNMLLVTYDGNVWYPTVYDLDTTWGTTWQGTGLYNYQTKLLSNGGSLLLDRIEQLYKKEIAERYFELRSTVLDTNYVMTKFNNFYNKIPSDVLEKEAEKWNTETTTIPGYPLSQIQEYLDCVIPRLDAKYEAWR